MSWVFCLLVAFQVVQPGSAGQERPAVPEQPAPPAPVYDKGPLRAEVTAMHDSRYWFKEESPNVRRSELAMQVRVAGEGLLSVVRVGTVIFEEAVDDTGKVLFDPSEVTEEMREYTRPVNRSPEQLRSSGFLLGPPRLQSPSRAAKTLKLRGYVRVILAQEREELTISNPLQYVGRIIEHERLKELDIQVRLVPAEELEGKEPPDPKRTLTVQYVKGGERMQSLNIHDAWMKPIRSRPRPAKTKTGDAVTSFLILGEGLNEDCQLVLKVFPTIEDAKVPVEIDALPLP